ncbi:MAG: metallophosphoesterase [Oscillospiraceae bacterium]
MKLLILSDVHGEYQLLADIVKTEKDVNAIIFLGDGLQDMYTLQRNVQLPRTYLVRGNCDFSYSEPSESLAAFDGLLVFYTHGNGYDVKWTMAGITAAAKARGADIALFGHTHAPFYEIHDGIHLFNPGSVSRPRIGRSTYGILEIRDGVPRFKHKEVP